MKRFVIRDRDTKELMVAYDHNLGKDIIQDSDCKTTARRILSSLRFGLSLDYEVYDNELERVDYSMKEGQNGRGRKSGSLSL